MRFGPEGKSLRCEMGAPGRNDVSIREPAYSNPATPEPNDFSTSGIFTLYSSRPSTSQASVVLSPIIPYFVEDENREIVSPLQTWRIVMRHGENDKAAL